MPSVITTTHCPYCALQCGMHLTHGDSAFEIAGNTKFPVNRGGLCIKGWHAASTLGHPERLCSPLVREGSPSDAVQNGRDERGTLSPTTWDVALDVIARRIADVQRTHGRDAIGVFGGGSLTNEKAYLLGKFARVALRTPHIDYNGRFCMSSAAAAANRAFGLDRGLPFPVADIVGADVVLLAGGNIAETMPPLMQYFEAQQAGGGKLVVVDPRRTPTAAWATMHLAARPGSDAALANGLLHVLIRENLIDRTYIRDRTSGFDEVHRIVAGYWPERVERLTGIPEGTIVETALLLGRAARPMVITARGPEQQSHGVDNALAYINVALALGAVGKASSGYGSITGQGNGQGGREHGQKADQLPGYRRIDDPRARADIARVWDVAEQSIPPAGRSAYELLDSMGEAGGVRALIVMGSNPLVSAPDATRIRQRFESLDLLVVCDFFLSDTAALADVVLPSAQWAEEDGTMTNLEGRVILRRRATPPPGAARSDIDILCSLAARLGAGRHFQYGSTREVFDELARATRGAPADYSGISYERIDAEDGVFWPCPSADHPGTPRLFLEAFPTDDGRARFSAVHHQSIGDEPGPDFPLYLTTGRVLSQYQSGNQTRRVAALRDLSPEPIAEMHPSTAKLAGVENGDRAALVTSRAAATFTVKTTASIREDTVFVPFHWPGAQSANRLTSAALDPTSRMPEFKACAAKVVAAVPIEHAVREGE